LDNSSAKWIDANCVIVAMYGATAAKVAINKIPLTTNQACCNLSIDEKIADYHYVYYWLCANYTELASLANGGAQQNLNAQQIKEFEISLPSLPEQRRITGILGAIDDNIENNCRINDNLEQQAQALYKQWFVDFEFPNEEGKPYKSSGGKMVDSELGPIPDGWSVIGYCDAVDIKGGGTPPTNNPEFWNGSIPFFTPKDVSSDCFAIHTEKSITEAGLSNCNSKLYAKDTVFITARGTVGKVVMAGCSMAMNQTNYALIGKNELSQYFVYLLTIALVDRLLKKANGAVFNAITTRDFEGEQIVHPTNFVLGKFIDIISPLYQQVLSIAKENETLATLRDTLLPKLINGEIKL
jgi:type I restriction enzyme S subunit